MNNIKFSSCLGCFKLPLRGNNYVKVSGLCVCSPSCAEPCRHWAREARDWCMASAFPPALRFFPRCFSILVVALPTHRWVPALPSASLPNVLEQLPSSSVQQQQNSNFYVASIHWLFFFSLLVGFPARPTVGHEQPGLLQAQRFTNYQEQQTRQQNGYLA